MTIPPRYFLYSCSRLHYLDLFQPLTRLLFHANPHISLIGCLSQSDTAYNKQRNYRSFRGVESFNRKQRTSINTLTLATMYCTFLSLRRSDTCLGWTKRKSSQQSSSKVPTPNPRRKAICEGVADHTWFGSRRYVVSRPDRQLILHKLKCHALILDLHCRVIAC